jgi:hypothetical protein
LKRMVRLPSVPIFRQLFCSKEDLEDWLFPISQWVIIILGVAWESEGMGSFYSYHAHDSKMLWFYVWMTENPSVKLISFIVTPFEQ